MGRCSKRPTITRINGETLTSTATGAVAAEPVPLTASISAAPESHDGNSSFAFELHFSDEFKQSFSFKTLRDHAFTVTGGEMLKARQLDPPSNICWEIAVRRRDGRHHATGHHALRCRRRNLHGGPPEAVQPAGADRRRARLTRTSGKSQCYLWERRLQRIRHRRPNHKSRQEEEKIAKL